MGTGVLKWLASLGTGAASTLLLYLSANAGDPTKPIDGVDSLVSFVLISLITKAVTWLTSKMPVTPSATDRRL